MSRSDEFYGGTQVAAYHPTSVLESGNSRPTGNGWGDGDRDRLLVGGAVLPSHNGRSDDTWGSRQQSWLDTPYRPLGFSG